MMKHCAKRLAAAMLSGLFVMIMIVAAITTRSEAAEFASYPVYWCEYMSPSGVAMIRYGACQAGDRLRVGVNMTGTGETVLFASAQDDYGTIKYLRRPKFVNFGIRRLVWRAVNLGFVVPSPPPSGQTTTTVRVWLSLASPSEQDFEADELLDVPFVFPLTVSLDSSGPAGLVVEPGETNVEVVRYRLSAMGSDVLVNNMAVQGVGNNDCDFQNLRLMNGDMQIGVAVPTLAAGCFAFFNNLNLVVAADSATSISLILDVASTASLGDSFGFNLVGVGAGVPVAGLPVQGRQISVCVPGEPCSVSIPDPIY